MCIHSMRTIDGTVFYIYNKYIVIIVIGMVESTESQGIFPTYTLQVSAAVCVWQSIRFGRT